METDSLDLNNMFYLDDAYLQSLMRLNEEDKLRVSRISLNSPLEIVMIVVAVPAAIVALWGMVLAFNTIANYNKLRLDVQKLERDDAEPAATSEQQEIEDVTEFDKRLRKSALRESKVSTTNQTRTQYAD